MSVKIKIEELVGKKYGRLIILDEATPVNGRRKVICKCDCGKVKEITLTHLRAGNILSCGCLQKERVVETHGKHNDRKNKLYSRWKSMKQRCNNPNNPAYKNYGARGIKVCEEWNSDYLKFKEWSINNGYSEELEIDRIDNSKGYEPGNCRYVTSYINNTNRRNTVIVEGVPIRKYIKEKNPKNPKTFISDYYIAKKIHSNENIIKKIELVRSRKKIGIKIEGFTFKQIEETFGVSFSTIMYRYNKLIKSNDNEITIKKLIVSYLDENKLKTSNGLTLTDLSEQQNIPLPTIRQRYSLLKERTGVIPSSEDIIEYKRKYTQPKTTTKTSDGKTLYEIAKVTKLSINGLRKRFYKLKERLDRIPSSYEIINYMLIPR